MPFSFRLINYLTPIDYQNKIHLNDTIFVIFSAFLGQNVKKFNKIQNYLNKIEIIDNIF